MSNIRKNPLMKRRRIIYSSEEDITCEEHVPNDLSCDSFTVYEDKSSSSCSIANGEDDDSSVEDNYSDGNSNNNVYIPENNSEWSEIDIDPVLHEFTGPEGFKVDISANSTTYDLFSLFFDNDLFEKIVQWTNAHAEMLINTTYVSNDSTLKKWKNVTIDEMMNFFGLCIMMGNLRMPTFKSYWSTDILYYHPLFGKTMSRNRYESILRCLRFYDETADKSNRLHKIDQVLNRVLQNIQNVYYPGKNLSIDEALLLWRGRLQFKQYIPQKKAKYGIKIYELCTSDGFVLNAIIYCGKNTVSNENGHASCVVYKLLHNYLGKGHTIYMDNFYNSVQLATSLYGDKTHAVGTLRKNRKGNPKLVVDKKLKRGESVFARNGNILVQKWRDKRDVLTISTKHDTSMKEVQCKNGKTVNKPSIIVDYNSNMSGIDRADQMVSYYSSPRKSIRWYMKVFFHILDITIWNACCLYNKVHSTKMCYLDFRNDLIKKLLKTDDKIPVLSYGNASDSQHFPQKMDHRLRCRVCATKKRRKETFYTCPICKTTKGELIGLCVDECFRIYHERK